MAGSNKATDTAEEKVKEIAKAVEDKKIATAADLIGAACVGILADAKDLPTLLNAVNDWYVKEKEAGRMSKEKAQEILDASQLLSRFAERLHMEVVVMTSTDV